MQHLTIKDIARLSGVGKSTVSRVLNHESGVRDKTREHVEAVIRQYGFTPLKSARAMRGQSDNVVVIIVSRLSSLSENVAVSEMLPLFYQQGYDPILMESQFCAERVEEHLQRLQRRRVDGIILFGFNGLDESILAPWRAKLVIMAREVAGFTSVCYDDEGAIRLLMDELYRHGHREISYLGVKEGDPTTGAKRYQAYQTCCHDYGLSPKAVLTGLSYQQGYQQVREVVTEQTSALVCATDNLALGASKFLFEDQREGVQLSSIGYTPLVRFMLPHMLTVDPGYQEAGRLAAFQLMGQIEQIEDIHPITVPCQLK
ncbi:MAG: HTH-type transcriptional regulator TreR [Candidatus Celerinatantimonas neptuna]|nr:MAG: HTH-type transcriptional regulator TreR [Candidatus Celerinatantimonas neptuna]